MGLTATYLGNTNNEYRTPTICTNKEAVSGIDENGSLYTL